VAAPLPEGRQGKTYEGADPIDGRLLVLSIGEVGFVHDFKPWHSLEESPNAQLVLIELVEQIDELGDIDHDGTDARVVAFAQSVRGVERGGEFECLGQPIPPGQVHDDEAVSRDPLDEMLPHSLVSSDQLSVRDRDAHARQRVTANAFVSDPRTNALGDRRAANEVSDSNRMCG